jgi:hypothetical protein
MTYMMIVAIAANLAQVNQGPGIWFEGHRLPAPELSRISYQGETGDGARFSLRIEQEQDFITFRGDISGVNFQPVRITKSRFPLLDLGSIEIGVGRGRVDVVIRYSEQNSCFINDDGRNRLRVSISLSRHVIYNTTINQCEARTVEM